MRTRVTPEAARPETVEGRTLRALISAETVDRESEVLLAAGAELSNYRRNPVLLWAHDAGLPPIGRAVSVEAEPGVGLWATNEFATTPFAGEILELYRGGFLRAFSVGFRPLEISGQPVKPGQTGPTIVRWELIEQSAVAVPANPDALVVAAGDGNRAADWLLKTYYAAPDEPALRARLGLPPGEVDWPALAAATYRFFGARGGARLAPADRQRAAALLRGLYERCGRAFPEGDAERPRLSSTLFLHDERDCFERREVADLAALLRGRALALRNIARKRRRRGEPIPELDPLAETAAHLAEVLGAGAPVGDRSEPDAGPLTTALSELRETLCAARVGRDAALAAALDDLRRGAIGGAVLPTIDR